MRKLTFNWRYLALLVMLFGVMSATYADENKNTSLPAVVDPELAVTPDPLDLGTWPIGGWQEPAILTLENVGGGSLDVTASEIEDLDRVYGLTNPTLPATLLATETTEVGVSFTSTTAAPGVYATTYVASWDRGRSVTTSDVTVTAYTPLLGDTKENPEVWVFVASPEPIQFEGTSSRELGGLYKNYILPNDVAYAYDEVWKIEAAQDLFFSMNLTSTNTNMALYAGDFSGEAGPMASNALIQDLTTITDFPLFEGTYYLVVGGDDAVMGTASMVPMTAPAMVVNVAPLDGAVDITNGMDLEWTYGGTDAISYEVVLGTTYPPTDVVFSGAASAMGDTYELAGLENNLQYFWSINTVNNVGTTEGEVWGFTTTITPAMDVEAASEELFEGDEVVLTWESPLAGARALLGYNVYRDGVMINASMLTTTTYTDATALVYNMAPGYTYNVTAVFDEGESGFSDDVVVTVSGEETFSGNVSDGVTLLDIAGATVDFDGLDEYSNLVTYSTTTDANGDYTQDVKVGTYDITVTADGYIDGVALAAGIDFGVPEVRDFVLSEVAYELEFVVATELDDDEVHLEYGFLVPTYVPTVFPFDTEGMNDAQIEKHMIDFLSRQGIANATEFSMDAVANGTRELESYDIYRGLWNDDFSAMTYVGNSTQTQFIDYDWGVQTSGVYKWAVVVVYTASESLPTYSNYLDKDMETLVNVEVALNSAESPAGTSVTLTNTSEPYLNLEYSTVLGDDGMYTFDPVRKGMYDVVVSLWGFTSAMETVAVLTETDLSYLLDELLVEPSNFYVNPNGYATWTGAIIPYVAFSENNFDAGVPADWTITAGGNTADTWFSATDFFGNTFDGTPFMFVNSDWAGPGTNMDELFVSPVINTTGQATVILEFDQHYNDAGWDPDYANVEVFDGTEWVTVLNQTSSSPGWWSDHRMIDVSMYANADFQVRFHYYAPDWDWYWAIDNVVVHNGGLRSTRELEQFRVWLDDVLSGEPTDEFWDYEVEEALVEGTTYDATLASIYTTGISPEVYYTFTYHACDYYNSASAFTATRTMGTMDIELAWTNDAADVDADVFIGTNVYRDGVFVALVEAGTASYTDETVASGDYTYCLTQMYASEAESCEVCDDVTMTPGGYVNGTVTMFDGGLPIEGANVLLVGATDTYSFDTDAAGYYEGEVVEGTYDYVVTATAMETAILEDVVIDFGATVIKDFALLEFPYAVGDVIATELDDDKVLVNWSGQGGGGGPEGVDFDFEDNLLPAGMMVDAPNADWNVTDGMMKITTAGAAVWRSAYYDEDFSDFVYEVEMQRNSGSEGGSMGILVRADGHTTLTAGDGSNGLMFCVSGFGSYFYGTITDGDLPDWSGWLPSAAINTGLGSVNVVSAEASGSVVNFFINNTLVHTQVTTITSGFCGVFAHEGDVAAEVAWDSFIVVPEATAINYDVAQGPSTEVKGYFDNVFTSFDSPGKLANGVNILPAQTSTRALLGYNVYRGECGADDEDMTFMGYTLDMQFTDNTWGAATEGIYSWAVESVYDFNESEFTYSNCLDKDMVTTVSVTVTTNSADSPIGTDVMFTNVSEITDPVLVYEVELDDTGMYTWDEFRKGTYDIYVHLNGFEDIMMSGVDIWDAADFEFVLQEILAPVSDLYVTPLGYATWGSGGAVPFEPVMENFDAGLPETWTVVVGGSTSDTWHNTAAYSGNSLDGTPFMFVDSDAAGSGTTMDEMLISPVIENTEAADMLYVEFDYIYQYISNEFFEVDVFDGDAWVNVFHSEEDSGPWPWGATVHASIDVTEYANEDFQVQFHYVSNGWNWYVAVDNFAVTEGDSRFADRELEYYKVWHDYTFVTDTDTTFYQYGDNGEELVEGQTYMAEVAAVYSTGISAKMFYEWTYYPCETFAGPAQFIAENVESTKDVLLTWSDILPMSLVHITQNPGAPANGYYQAYGSGYGVAYDLSAYPDALANTIEFHHASWGVMGPFDYNIHIIDWDTEAVLAVLGPFTTTGDDVWEMDVQLGDVDLMGASTVAFLMEPLSNSAADAYPDLSSDSDADPQGSIYGPLDDISSIGASTIGNFLMNINIMTANGPVRVSSTELDVPVAIAASPRVGLGTPVSKSIITNQVATREVTDLFMGANLYRDDVMIAEMVMDTFYLDEELVPDFYDYCIKYVYESGAMSCGTCIMDVMVPEDCDAPQNLTATLDEETWESIDLAWNQAMEVEYRYDDGVATGQLGSGTGTTNTLLGNVHRVDAELSEMSWLTTAEGGPHSTIDIWVLGLDASGIPDGNNVLFTSTVSNTDDQWNTFTFNEPLMVEGGFFLGVSYNGFAAIGTDDGVGAPYEFVLNTHYFVGDYTAGGWETWETYNFNLNATIRATGMEAAVASYAVEPTVSEGTSDLTYVASLEATSVGSPDWTNPIANSSRSFTGFNIYRDGDLIVEGYQDNTYTDTEGLVGGELYCYEVTAMYSVCGESEPSNEACAGFVGIPGIDASDVSVYPNPATSLVNISSSQELTRVTVINYVGQVVYELDLNEATSVQLNTSSFENGVYVVRLDSENGVVTKRVIIAQ